MNCATLYNYLNTNKIKAAILKVIAISRRDKEEETKHYE